MLRTKVVKGMLGVSAGAALLAALTVQAQNSGTPATSTGQTEGQTSGQTSSQGSGQAGARTGSAAGMAVALNKSDQKIVKEMAMGNLADIEAARLAQSKSGNEQVKSFSQKMIGDHTKALGEVQQLAQAKGVSLPTELDMMHKRKIDKLAAMSGDAFDRAYMAQAGVSEHKKTHSQLRKAQARAKDPDVRALAERTLPIVSEHLTSAQEVRKNTARGSSKTQGTTGASPDKVE